MDEYIYSVKDGYRSDGAPQLYRAKVIKRTPKTVRIDRHDDSAYGFNFAMVMKVDGGEFYDSAQEAIQAYINRRNARVEYLETEISRERNKARLASEMLLEFSIDTSNNEI